MLKNYYVFMNFKKRVSFGNAIRFQLDYDYAIPDDLKLNTGLPRTSSYTFSPNRKKAKSQETAGSVRFSSVLDQDGSSSNGSVPRSSSGSASSRKNWLILELAKNAKSKTPQNRNPETMTIV